MEGCKCGRDVNVIFDEDEVPFLVCIGCHQTVDSCDCPTIKNN